MQSIQRKILMGALALVGCPAILLAQDAPAQGPPPGMTRPEMGPRGAIGGPGFRGGPWMQRDGQRLAPAWREGRFGGRRGPWGRFARHQRRVGMGLAAMLQNPGIRERIGVSAEQAAKIQGQQSAFAKTRIRDQADLRVKRLELRDLLRAEKPDRTAIDKKLRELSEVQLAAQKSAIDHQLAMRDALTAEQKEKMREVLRERMRDGHMPGPQRLQEPPRPPATE